MGMSQKSRGSLRRHQGRRRFSLVCGGVAEEVAIDSGKAQAREHGGEVRSAVGSLDDSTEQPGDEAVGDEGDDGVSRFAREVVRGDAVGVGMTVKSDGPDSWRRGAHFGGEEEDGGVAEIGDGLESVGGGVAERGLELVGALGRDAVADPEDDGDGRGGGAGASAEDQAQETGDADAGEVRRGQNAEPRAQSRVRREDRVGRAAKRKGRDEDVEDEA
mmetsp:Transcript_10530/g.31721  ORF Transcript_10530/g.31721 Transcript_10530/m.31721 type:complete len:217 (-) Transcript_10530:1867-2517(-)